ncbi:uncharacterized protein LOC102800827 [Saccoglossus kowalevskii]
MAHMYDSWNSSRVMDDASWNNTISSRNMSKSLHSSHHNRQSNNQSHNQSSASAELHAYINNFETSYGNLFGNQRAVNDSMSLETTLQLNFDRKQEAREKKTELHRHEMKKLIDKSYREIVRADVERHKAETLLHNSQNDSTSENLSPLTSNSVITDVESLDTEALISAPINPRKPYTQYQRNALNRYKSGSLGDLPSRLNSSAAQQLYHTPARPAQLEHTHLSPNSGGRPAPSWVQDMDTMSARCAPSWVQDLDTVSACHAPSWVQDLDLSGNSGHPAPSWIQDLDSSDISNLTQSSVKLLDIARRRCRNRKNSKLSEEGVLLKRYGSAADLLMSDSSDWQVEEFEHIPKAARLSHRNENAYSLSSDSSGDLKAKKRILTTPEKNGIKHELHRWGKHSKENSNASQEVDSYIQAAVGRKLNFKYSKDDSDISTNDSFFLPPSRRNLPKRPLLPVHDTENTSYFRRSNSENHDYLKRAQSFSKITSTNTDDLINASPRGTALKAGIHMNRRAVSAESVSSDLPARQVALQDPVVHAILAKAEQVLHTPVPQLKFKSKDLTTSPLTEDVLDGDRSWEKNLPCLKPPRHVGERSSRASENPTIIDKFLEDCLQSNKEMRGRSDDDSPRLTGGEQPGPVEALKTMLFTMQKVAAEENSSTSSSPTVQKLDFESEAGGQSLQRAMQHLFRLKTLVNSDTETGSQQSVSSAGN